MKTVQVDDNIINIIDRVHCNDGILLGHGSFFRKEANPQDIDLIKISIELETDFKKRKILIGNKNIDLTEINIKYINSRFKKEASFGYQFLSRTILASELLVGSELIYKTVVRNAKTAEAWDPRQTGRSTALFNRDNLSSILMDLPRLQGWKQKACLISSFEHLVRLGFHVRGEWLVPPSCSNYWSKSTESFMMNSVTALQQALDDNTKPYLDKVKEEMSRMN